MNLTKALGVGLLVLLGAALDAAGEAPARLAIGYLSGNAGEIEPCG